MQEYTPGEGVPQARPRVDYRFAATDGRAAVERAAKAGCSDAEFRTLLGVICLVTLYHRSEERVWLPQLAKTVGATGPSGPAMVGRHLRALHKAGVIEYYPAHGRGRLGRIVVPKVVRLTRVYDDKTSVWDTENSRLQNIKLASGTRPAFDLPLDRSLRGATHREEPFTDERGTFLPGTGWVAQ